MRPEGSNVLTIFFGAHWLFDLPFFKKNIIAILKNGKLAYYKAQYQPQA